MQNRSETRVPGTMITGDNETAADSKRKQNAHPEFGALPGLKSVEWSQGSEVEIVTISREGMILETDTRLRPDFKVMLKVVTGKGPMRIHGIVLRTAICSLAGGPRYRSEVAFRQPLELFDEGKVAAPAIGASGEIPIRGDAEVARTETPAILTVLHAATMAPA
jgi:hypothetical protein